MILLAHAASLLWTSDLFLYMVIVAMACSTKFYKLDTVQWLFMVFMGWSLITIAVNPHPVLAIHGWMLRCEGFLTLAILARAAWLYWSNYRTLEALTWTCAGLCIAITVLDCLGLCHIPMMAIAGWMAPAAVLMWAYEPSLMILTLPPILMCHNRSMVIGIAVGILTYELLKKRWKICLSVLGAIIIISALHPPLRDKFLKINFDTYGMGSRSQWVQQAVVLSSKSPIFGTGWGTLSCHLTPPTGEGAEQGCWPDKTHNIAWDYIATTGIVGYILLLCVLGYGVGIAIKYEYRDEYRICLAALAAYIALGWFNPQGIPSHFIALAALMGLNRHRMND